MKIVKIRNVDQEKRISIQGFKGKPAILNGVLYIDAPDFQELQALMIEVYYS